MKIINKIKDLFNAIKYRKKMNTAINNYETLQDKYTRLLEENNQDYDTLKTLLADQQRQIKVLRNKITKWEADSNVSKHTK